MKRGLMIGLGLLLFAGCSDQTKEEITVTTNDPVEVSKILKEDQTENSRENFINETYLKEYSVTINPQQSLSALLLNYSWFNGSQILTFDSDLQITGSLFQGTKEKRMDSDYATYEILDDATLKIHIIGNYGPNVIQDYTYTVNRSEKALQLEDSTINLPDRETLQPVKKLIEANETND
ncbi:hypothetical protein [Enterococcus sp.]|uniref:hypothetical protein n=1 Tax=Enterococcus sp. TaxID=35783 RepID=UPI00290B069D|nr:hypothetical protein [Enterococcus sp.]MDU5334119.1 hypothetical protein [Enterococcus sp.]